MHDFTYAKEELRELLLDIVRDYTEDNFFDYGDFIHVKNDLYITFSDGSWGNNDVFEIRLTDKDGYGHGWDCTVEVFYLEDKELNEADLDEFLDKVYSY